MWGVPIEDLGKPLSDKRVWRMFGDESRSDYGKRKRKNRSWYYFQTRVAQSNRTNDRIPLYKQEGTDSGVIDQRALLSSIRPRVCF
jgi:hypothetical protein